MDMHAVVWKAVDSIRSNRVEDLDVETVAEAVNSTRFPFRGRNLSTGLPLSPSPPRGAQQVGLSHRLACERVHPRFKSHLPMLFRHVRRKRDDGDAASCFLLTAPDGPEASACPSPASRCPSGWRRTRLPFLSSPLRRRSPRSRTRSPTFPGSSPAPSG